MRFSNRVVVITGGSRGIGKAIVEEYAKEGAKVYFTYISSENIAKDIVNEQEKLGYYVKGFKCDSKIKHEVENFINKVIDLESRIDILVNNSGINRDEFLFLMTFKNWDDVINTNLYGTYYFTFCVMPHMLKNKKGVILNISSVAGIRGAAGQTNYCTSKFALVGFTKALAKEIGCKNIRVNSIAPGFIDTEMTEAIPENFRKEYLKQIPLKRFGKPKEIAKVVTFLSSDDSSYINGEVIVVDGGFSS
jgi:3-oxoacyl-[acyl-carrier protein] reductase